MLAEGRPLKEIANILNLSRKTIDFHKHRLMSSFNLKNNADVVLFALKRGIITTDPKPGLPSRKRAIGGGSKSQSSSRPRPC